MDQVSVYRFQVWDHEVGDNVWGPRMATQETIKRVRGVADLLTETRVAKTDLDGNGFYLEEKTSQSGRRKTQSEVGSGSETR